MTNPLSQDELRKALRGLANTVMDYRPPAIAFLTKPFAQGGPVAAIIAPDREEKPSLEEVTADIRAIFGTSDHDPTPP